MQPKAQPRSVPPPCPRPRERRREARQATRLEVDVATADGMVFVGTTLDLSLGGMCLEIGAPLAPGERLMLRLRLPGPDAMISTDAMVRWVRELASGLVVVGLSLPPLPTRDLRALRAFLDAEAWAGVSASREGPAAPPGAAANQCDEAVAVDSHASTSTGLHSRPVPQATRSAPAGLEGVRCAENVP
jgi:hypothetical protein